jgi:crotonobetainyl-CoA:carnitine CoA-transferase CaiB-like acyl-CoA transferase
VRELAMRCDVLVENFKVGGLAYGLDWDSLRAQPAPRLLLDHRLRPGRPLCRARRLRLHRPGHGRPDERHRRADDAPGGGPQKVGVAVADLFTGMYATIAVLAALTFRERTGQGQHIDLALLDAQVAMLANQNMNFLVSGQAPRRLGNAHPNIVPYQAFATADGHVILAVGNDAQFRRFCELAGCRAGRRPRFASNRDRVAHRAR